MFDKFSMFYLTTLGATPAVLQPEDEPESIPEMSPSWKSESLPTPEETPDDEESSTSWRDPVSLEALEDDTEPVEPLAGTIPPSWREEAIQEEVAPESGAPPSWYDPSWITAMPGHSAEEYDEDFSKNIPKFKEDFELKMFPKTRQKKETEPKPTPEKLKPAEKPGSTEPTAKPVIEPVAKPAAKPVKKPEDKFDGSGFEDARDYLLSFKDDPAFDTVIDGIEKVTHIIDLSRSKRSQRTVANALGFAIGAIESLITKVDLGEKKDDVVRAATIVKNFYSNAVTKLSPEFQEKVNAQIIKHVEGPKERPLQKFWSKWYNPDVTYVRNRAMIINKNEGLPFIQAEDQAEKEWLRIEEIVNGATKFAQADRDYLRTLFARMILGSSSLEGGDSFENVSKYIQGLINRGPNKDESKFYQDVETNLDPEDAYDLARNLAGNGDLDLGEELEDIGLPENEVESLASKIEEFGKKSLLLLKFGMDWEDRAKEGILPSDEAIEAAQTLYNEIVAIGSELSSLPQSLKAKAYNNGDVFKTIYAIASNVEKYTGVFGIETIEPTNQGNGRQLVDDNLSFINPMAKPPTEDEKKMGFRKKRIRNKKIEDSAKERYMQRVEASGSGEEYRNVRRIRSGLKEPTVVGRGATQHHEKENEGEFEYRKNLQKEYNKVVNADQGTTYKEMDRWLLAPSSRDINKEIDEIESYQYGSIKHLWHLLLRSFLSDTDTAAGINPHTEAEEYRTKEHIASVRKNDRTNKLNETLAQLEARNAERPSENIQKVIAALRLNIFKFENIWETAKDEEIAASMRPSSLRRPGEWTNKLVQERRKKERAARGEKISNITFISDMFYKLASTQ